MLSSVVVRRLQCSAVGRLQCSGCSGVLAEQRLQCRVAVVALGQRYRVEEYHNSMNASRDYCQYSGLHWAFLGLNIRCV